MSQKWSLLFSGKKLFGFLGDAYFKACIQNGDSCFHKTRLVIFRGTTHAFLMVFWYFFAFYVPKTGILVFRKQPWPISGGAKNK
jgi:hypothetical protein